MNPNAASFEFVRLGIFPDRQSENAEGLRQLVTSADGLWPHIISIADAQFVTAALWKGLCDKGLAGSIGPEPRQYLRAVYEMNGRRNTSLLLQLDEVVMALNEIGIVPVLLKGAGYLKANIFPDNATRIMADLDLLVSPHRIADSIAVLSELGYQAAEECTEEYELHHHIPPMVRDGEYGAIEIHRDALLQRAAQILPTDVILEAVEEAAEDRLRYGLLSPTHCVLMSFLHSQISDRFDYKFVLGLRPLQDLLALQSFYGDRIDWSGIYRLLKKQRQDAALRNYLFAAYRLADLTLLPEIRFGFLEQFHFAVCHALMRWELLDRWARGLDIAFHRVNHTRRMILGRDQR